MLLYNIQHVRRNGNDADTGRWCCNTIIVLRTEFSVHIMRKRFHQQSSQHMVSPSRTTARSRQSSVTVIRRGPTYPWCYTYLVYTHMLYSCTQHTKYGVYITHYISGTTFTPICTMPGIYHTAGVQHVPGYRARKMHT